LKNKPIGTNIPPNAFICVALATMMTNLYEIEIMFAFPVGIIFAYLFSRLDVEYRKQISGLNKKIEFEVKKNAKNIHKWIIKLVFSRVIFTFIFFVVASVLVGNILKLTKLTPYIVEIFFLTLIVIVVPIKAMVNFIRIFATKNG
jgi:hypothetical protein